MKRGSGTETGVRKAVIMAPQNMRGSTERPFRGKRDTNNSLGKKAPSLFFRSLFTVFVRRVIQRSEGPAARVVTYDQSK